MQGEKKRMKRIIMSAGLLVKVVSIGRLVGRSKTPTITVLASKVLSRSGLQFNSTFSIEVHDLQKRFSQEISPCSGNTRLLLQHLTESTPDGEL